MLFLGRLRRWWIDRSRDLFTYYDGARTRRADPLRVATQLEARCPDYLDHLATLNQKIESVPPGPMRADLLAQQKTAAAELVTAARLVFELPVLTDTAGLGDGEALQVLTRFFVYMEGLADLAQPFGSSPATV